MSGWSVRNTRDMASRGGYTNLQHMCTMDPFDDERQFLVDFHGQMMDAPNALPKGSVSVSFSVATQSTMIGRPA